MNPDYITIPLTKDKSCIVDPIDADLLQYKWCVSTHGYAHRSGSRKIKPRQYIDMHRLILERKIGRRLNKNESTDHINGNRLDNRRDNLRIASSAQNSWNQGLDTRNNTGYKGIEKRKNRWIARIRVNNTRIYLGSYGAPEEAYDAYCQAAEKYHQEFANLG